MQSHRGQSFQYFKFETVWDYTFKIVTMKQNEMAVCMITLIGWAILWDLWDHTDH